MAVQQNLEGRCKCACRCDHQAEEKFYKGGNSPPLDLCTECYEEWIEPSWWE